MVKFLLWYGWTMLGLAFIVIIGFLSESMRMIPKDRRGPERPCEPRCWLPPLSHEVWGDSEFRCKECGHTWLIDVDLNRPRENYRQWALAK